MIKALSARYTQTWMGPTLADDSICALSALPALTGRGAFGSCKVLCLFDRWECFDRPAGDLPMPLQSPDFLCGVQKVAPTLRGHSVLSMDHICRRCMKHSQMNAWKVVAAVRHLICLHAACCMTYALPVCVFVACTDDSYVGLGY